MALAVVQLSGQDTNFERRAIQHIRKTSMPEDLPELNWDPPLKGQDYVIIKQFILDPVKRPDRKMCPCPVCSGKTPKFYRGALSLWPAEGVYRFIGIDCAKNHVGEAQHKRAWAEYDAKKKHASDMQYVYDNLGHVPQMVNCVDRLLTAAKEIEALSHKFGRLKIVRDELRRHSEEAYLTLYEEAEVDRFDLRLGSERQSKQYIPVIVGRLKGIGMLRGSPGFTAELRILKQALEFIQHGEGEAAQEWFLQVEPSREELAQIKGLMRRSTTQYRRVFGKIVNAFEFFTEENFNVLREFGTHRLNPNQFFVGFSNGEYRISFADKHMRVRPDRGVIAALMPWPHLDEPLKTDL